MLAAEALGRAWAAAGIDVVFANPGTTELHLVDGFARVPEMRQILTLFEGVASGAADGYARMTGRPAVTLVHLGPGLSNALANLHNARRANTPVIALVGDHAVTHRKWDSPLQSDIAAIAGAVSVAVLTCEDPSQLGADGMAAVRAAIEQRGVATLIVPSDAAWGDATFTNTCDPPPLILPDPAQIAAAQRALASPRRAAIILGGGSLGREGLAYARAIGAATGAAILSDTFLPRLARGGGDPGPEVIPYFSEMAAARLAEFELLVRIGAKHPAGFFAYPGQTGECAAPGTESIEIALGTAGLDAAIAALAAAIGVEPLPIAPPVAPPARPADGPLTATALGQALAAMMPANAIVSDEANTTTAPLFLHTANARPHDWLRLTGGAIGQGLPLATGAAVACPGRRVIALQSDGSALYTLQALWTQARERLDVTTLLLNNRSYAILKHEMKRLDLDVTAPGAAPLFELGDPPIDFSALARGFDVPARSVTRVSELLTALDESLASSGPMLIDVALATEAIG